MRDPNRIDRMLEKLTTIWKNNPNLRLGQLVSNACIKGGFEHHDVFYAEDNITEDGLDAMKKEVMKKSVENYLEEQNQKLEIGKNKLPVIIEFLDKENTYLDATNIAYHQEEYPFTKDEFSWACSYLDSLNAQSDNGACNSFPERLTYYNYKGTEFVWRLLIGQGSILQIIKRECWEEECDGFFDEEKVCVIKDDE